ncbi:hypothetical protein CFE53_03295 [Methanofervidicoccus sp. A16]|uniref:FeGP cofactor biosynthesis guanylyltransferase HcgB family protein n=1 Tax=Methanofervidicoccus sp. A16 TaxID=2607662 RepID=UPI00118AEA35|nr:FeGP cofactor biosynthesis guanylyltransferase HcgB family protein [Methanofervidicoccus sp. A16]AXI25226.1 hypothetical protein CFE53_03295 [Methanofervidicoccus sp. A16]
MDKLETYIRKAYLESSRGERKGDKWEEVETIKNYILNSKKVAIATNNINKFRIIKDTLIEKVYKDRDVDIFKVDIPTEVADLTRLPALSKGLIAVDTTDAHLVIARGRLGVPGSGSILLIMDGKGRILSGSISPPSVIHKRSIEDTVREELLEALRRIGI